MIKQPGGGKLSAYNMLMPEDIKEGMAPKRDRRAFIRPNSSTPKSSGRVNSAPSTQRKRPGSKNKNEMAVDERPFTQSDKGRVYRGNSARSSSNNPYPMDDGARSPSPQFENDNTGVMQDYILTQPRNDMQNFGNSVERANNTLDKAGQNYRFNLLAKMYKKAKKRSSELNKSAGSNTGKDSSIPIKMYGQQASRVYSAISTLLYASMSLGKSDHLEAYIVRKASTLPGSIFDLTKWKVVLDAARDVREMARKPFSFDKNDPGGRKMLLQVRTYVLFYL